MNGPGEFARSSPGGERPRATFFCRDCRAYFQSDATADGGRSARCPVCGLVSFTVEMEREDRRREADVAAGLSLFGWLFNFPLVAGPRFPSVPDETDMPPNPFEKTPPLARSSHIGRLVETYLRGDALGQLDTDRQVWEFYLWKHGNEVAGELLEEVDSLLALSPREAFDAVNALCLCEGQTFISPPTELVAWLKELKAFLEQFLDAQR